MEQVNIYEARTHFSKYVEQAESGEDVIIDRGEAVIDRAEKAPSPFCVLKGKVRVSADFDDPLPDALVAGFEWR